MLDSGIVKLLNGQINMEWYSAYMYLDIYTYYMDKNLNGFGNWFNIQTQEERDHALLFITYMLNNDVKPELHDIKASTKVFKEFREPAEAAYIHEQAVTASINNIYGEAQKLKDFKSMQFLDWFVKEQGEEEKNTLDILKRYDLFGSDPKGLYMLDSELGARTYVAPSLVL